MPQAGGDHITAPDGTTSIKDWNNFNNINMMVQWRGNMLEDKLRLDIGGNFAIAREDENNKINRMMFNAEYDIIEGLSVRGELGLLDLSDLEDDVWGTWGISIPTKGVLDMLSADFEYHSSRDTTEGWLNGGPADSDLNLGWIIQVAKVFKEVVRWDIGFGVDPGADGFNSRTSSDIGVISRIGLRF
jgi:hypothetical protein